MQENLNRHELEDVLRFYAESGLDYAVLDTAVDQFAAFEAQKNAAKPGSTAPVLPIAQAERRPIPQTARVAAIPDEAAIASAIRSHSGAAAGLNRGSSQIIYNSLPVASIFSARV